MSLHFFRVFLENGKVIETFATTTSTRQQPSTLFFFVHFQMFGLRKSSIKVIDFALCRKKNEFQDSVLCDEFAAAKVNNEMMTWCLFRNSAPFGCSRKRAFP